MNWTVAWDPDARSELHQLWAVAPDPAAVRSAADTAERLLALDPFGNGEYLAEGLWRVRVPPLVFHYSVDLLGRRVQITDVAPTA